MPTFFLHSIVFSTENQETVFNAPVFFEGRAPKDIKCVKKCCQNKKKHPETCVPGCFFLMPVVGVEPTRVISTRDFESPSSAIPTHRLMFRTLFIIPDSLPKIKTKNQRGNLPPAACFFFVPGGGQNPRRAVYWGQMFYTTGGFSCEKL